MLITSFDGYFYQPGKDNMIIQAAEYPGLCIGNWFLLQEIVSRKADNNKFLPLYL